MRSWIRREKNRVRRIWRDQIRRPVFTFFRWWILWLSLVLVATLYLVGVRFIAVGDLEGFHSNLLAEIIGVLLALAVAWLLIERHFQNQARRISTTVKDRVRTVRDVAARQVTNLTTAAFNIPDFNSQDRGHWYIRDNYNEIRDLVWLKGARPQWFRGGNRDPQQVALMGQEMGELT